MIPKFIDKLRLPHKSGVYIFQNVEGKVLYIGKAIDLKHRVASYFTKDLPVKTSVLVSQIAGLETIIVESELEALILEANLIKKYFPPFNVRLTDDKDYLYIGVTREDSPRSAGGAGFPKVITLRKHELKKVKKYWGPFPSSRTVRDTLKLLRKVFPWCSGKGVSLRVRPCFYYHIDMCPGACIGSINKQDYNKIIRRFSKFMEGKKEELTEEMTREMVEASNQQKFEEAARLKKMLDGISYLTQTNRVRSYLENPNFLEDETKLALGELQRDLQLPNLPERIEGYDISNIGGNDATGSMVVLTNGEIDRSQYRRFKIHISGKPNDVGMLKEIIRRRLTHLEWPMPDLVIVDGGRGQVRGVFNELRTTNYPLRPPLAWLRDFRRRRREASQLPLFGLAKRMEWLYPPAGEIIKLPKKSLSLKLLQKLRDEAHRFALTYHRKLRDTILK